MSKEQLYKLKHYILNNLYKGFITSLNALYAALILFAKKANRSLQIYIDYCKLNKLIKKDLYSISLINKMMAYISKAKIFIKLNIQQAFYCIYINKDSKKLTIF